MSWDAGRRRARESGMVVAAARSVLEALGAAILAADCPCCRRPMGWGRWGVCAPCWEEVAPLTTACCEICLGALSPGGAPRQRRCAACASRRQPFAAVVAGGLYAGRMRDVIRALKYGGRERLAAPLGGLMATALRAAGLEGMVEEGPVVVAVPLSAERRAERGYNQSELLARALARALPRRKGAAPRLVTGLVKKVDRPPQAGLSREQRLRSPAGSFAPARGAARDLEGRGVILVDDVLTTGATASDCARALEEAGASSICVVVAARTPLPGPLAGREPRLQGRNPEGGHR